MRLGLEVKYVKKRRAPRKYNREKTLPVTMIKIAITMITLTFTMTWMVIRVRPIILEMAENAAGDIVEYIINEAVSEEIAANSANYHEIVSFEKSDGGEIKAVYTNTIKINELKSGIIKRIQEKVRTYDTIEVKVPLGAIFDLELFPALGPRIKFEMISTGFVNADFSSEFDAAGINQTRHQIDVIIDAELGVVGAMGNRSVQVQTSVPVAQSVIVGAVPERYNSPGTY